MFVKSLAVPFICSISAMPYVLNRGYIMLILHRFDIKIAAAVAEETNLPFVTAENKFEALVIS